MQDVTLTSDERQVVLDYATRLEKRGRQWRFLRWLAVACFAFGLVLLLAVDRLSARTRNMLDMLELPSEALNIPGKTGSESVESSLRLLAAHGDIQIAALRAEFYLVLKVIIIAGIGTALFVHAVSEWRRDRRDRLVVRLLRSFVADTGDSKHESYPLGPASAGRAPRFHSATIGLAWLASPFVEKEIQTAFDHENLPDRNNPAGHHISCLTR
jgi:hypothetical protein